MRKHTLYFPDEQMKELSTFNDGISISEHIRLAIKEYIEKKKRERLNVSNSPSIIVFSATDARGGDYGRTNRD